MFAHNKVRNGINADEPPSCRHRTCNHGCHQHYRRKRILPLRIRVSPNLLGFSILILNCSYSLMGVASFFLTKITVHSTIALRVTPLDLSSSSTTVATTIRDVVDANFVPFFSSNFVMVS